MKPLKAELDALRAVLMTPLSEFISDKEEAEHKDPEGLAQKRMFEKAIEAVDEARGQRTMHVVVLRHGNGDSTLYSSYGPYATKPQADKAYERYLSGFWHTAVAVVPLRNQEGVEQLVASLDARPEKRAPSKAASDELDKRMRSCSAGVRTHLRDVKIKPLGDVWELHEKVKRGLS